MEKAFLNKISFTSLGCARNLVDSEVMIGLLLKRGYQLVYEIENADFHVINTCGFLESSRQEALDIIGEIYQYKKKGAKVVVTGCMVQKHRSILDHHFPQIDYMLGAGDVEKIINAIESEDKGSEIGSQKSYLQQGQVPRFVTTPKHYAYLKIAEGCKKRCSFCIIPDIKGPLQSKTIEQVVKEFNILLSQGVYEIILIAQDLGDFGKDRKEKDGLYLLLKELLKSKKDFWIRLLYLYPDEIDDQIIALMQEDKRICPYLDMPLQHINDRILKLMHRKTSRNQIIETITKLREKIPNVVIRTSLMVGFPTETEEEFLELVDFVKSYSLDNIGIFAFSKEEQAYASKLSGHLSQEIKEKRVEILAEAQLEQVRKKQQDKVGNTYRVVIEGYHPESKFLLVGRYYGQCPEIDGQVIINDARGVDEFGVFYNVEITDVSDYDLVGKVISKEQKENPLALCQAQLQKKFFIDINM